MVSFSLQTRSRYPNTGSCLLLCARKGEQDYQQPSTSVGIYNPVIQGLKNPDAKAAPGPHTALSSKRQVPSFITMRGPSAKQLSLRSDIKPLLYLVGSRWHRSCPIHCGWVMWGTHIERAAFLNDHLDFELTAKCHFSSADTEVPQKQHLSHWLIHLPFSKQKNRQLHTKTEAERSHQSALHQENGTRMCPANQCTAPAWPCSTDCSLLCSKITCGNSFRKAAM